VVIRSQMWPRVGLVAICLPVLALIGCGGTIGAVDVSARIAFAPTFSGKVKDRQSGHTTVHDEGQTVTIIATSNGTFSVKASHLSGPLASIPAEFTHGRYSEKATFFRLKGSTVEHYHSVALLRFSDKAAGSACVLINGPENLSTARMQLTYSVLGGTGEAGKVRMTGSAQADIGVAPVQLSGRGKLGIGKPRPAPAECRKL
jgi:hypothetical protein